MTKKTIRLTGHTLSPGLAKGHVFVHDDVMTDVEEFYDITPSQTGFEVDRFDEAVRVVSSELGDLVERVGEEIDHELAAIFETHVHILQDDGLREEVIKEITDELVSAGGAIRTVFRRWEHRFGSMESDTVKHTADDVHDLARRLLCALAGTDGHILKNIPEDSVLVARRLSPSDTIYLSRRSAAAVLVEQAGYASHAALFVREIGIPCISGISDLLESIPPDSLALVDADTAEAIINPTEKQLDAFRERSKRSEKAKRLARTHSREVATTQDGTVIHVCANVGLEKDSQHAVENGADGIGLYRIEQAYLGRQVPPNLSQLSAELEETLSPATHLPVCVRLLDVGGDKPLPFLNPVHESNPALGLRGVRFLLHHTDLLDVQMRTLLHLSTRFDLSILVPMVTLPEDMRAIHEVMVTLAEAESISTLPKLGAMIETPAAALTAAGIAEHADFLSFGTNDLTQYAFAADRENAAVDSYFDDTNPVVTRLIEAAHRDAPDTRLSLCGELAGRCEVVERLLRCGITTLSVAPPLIPAVKEAVRQSTIERILDSADTDKI